MFIDLNYFKFYIYVSIIYATMFYLYFFMTKFNKVITVKEEFMIGINKKILNIITDTDGTLYLVDNKFMLLNFDAAETLSMIQKGKSYRISGYGVRIPFLDMYENITSCSYVN